MGHLISISEARPCRICGNRVLLRFRDHVRYLTALGEPRFAHTGCLPGPRESPDQDDLAA